MKRKGVGNAAASRTILLALLLIAGMVGAAYCKTLAPGGREKEGVSSQNVRKILFVASYNTKNLWSGGIQAGIESVLRARKDIELRVINMDTMGVHSEETKKEAAIRVKREIESYRPDVVIASDDNASKYLIVPYFNGANIPFVFCGINWDASKYGFPSANVTGMIEVQLVDQLVAYLSPYAKGNRIGSLRGDTMTNRIEAEHFERQLRTPIETFFVKDINEWKKQYIQLQDDVDILLLGDIDTINLGGESKADVERFILDNTKIPTGHWDAWFKRNALITIATSPEEQGEYAAETALAILDGKSPADIPLVKNKRAVIYLNMILAKKLGIVFPMSLVESARIVPAD